MKKFFKKKAVILASALTLLTGTVALAETQSGQMVYQDLTANYSLSVDWNLFDNDNATAETKFVNPNQTNNVAVRLEMWKTSSGMTDYKYTNSKSWATRTYSWPGVYEYKSRHSIDNSTSTSELIVRTLSDW